MFAREWGSSAVGLSEGGSNPRQDPALQSAAAGEALRDREMRRSGGRDAAISADILWPGPASLHLCFPMSLRLRREGPVFFFSCTPSAAWESSSICSHVVRSESDPGFSSEGLCGSPHPLPNIGISPLLQSSQVPHAQKRAHFNKTRGLLSLVLALERNHACSCSQLHASLEKAGMLG